MTTVFTPLVKGFSWTPATTDINGNPFPAGEVETGTTIGIRADGDTVHGVGNYQYLVIVPATQNSEAPGAITAALGKALAPGNYWAALDQTDTLNGSPSTSPWTPEIAFSIPAVVAQPAAPTNFTAA